MRVGIIGGGQLGRMLVQAGADLGIACTTLDPNADSPAARVGPAIVGAYDDADALASLAAEADVVTYEFENVPVAGVRALAERVPVHPGPASLEAGQDRLAEKHLFTEVGLPVPLYAAVEDLASLPEAIEAVGLPAVLKSRRLGYDGKGQVVIADAALAEDAWRRIGEVPALLEALVPFDQEVSILSVRGRDGEIRSWPLVENEHEEGILRRSFAPARGAEPPVQAAAEAHAGAILERLDHVGVLAIELFRVGEELFGNEMAPRVHNSGHWTIEGAETSQFENHLRAICGLPLGETTVAGHAAMVNLIGGVPEAAEVLRLPGAHLHLYGKRPLPRRKVGHVTLRGDDPRSLWAKVLQVSELAADA
ncbi:MAG TPA: 5-(carboxyamino)imidazole ribonucleotide synthase [Actinomycetota bacterium]|nr:5-(carboxyamino)imidazole ribonucleotide synthase [Actinomycetota bacterium]